MRKPILCISLAAVLLTGCTAVRGSEEHTVPVEYTDSVSCDKFTLFFPDGWHFSRMGPDPEDWFVNSVMYDMPDAEEEETEKPVFFLLCADEMYIKTIVDLDEIDTPFRMACNCCGAMYNGADVHSADILGCDAWYAEIGVSVMGSIPLRYYFFEQDNVTFMTTLTAKDEDDIDDFVEKTNVLKLEVHRPS
ncbi:MAG: hypothetical protein IK130_09985 [Oscillospiraceae bacterium]|nr:hypothetical protein [Oscillospiraceae bacterium]